MVCNGMQDEKLFFAVAHIPKDFKNAKSVQGQIVDSNH